VSQLEPALYQQFLQIYRAIGTPEETDVVRAVYQRLKPINFSKDFLEAMVKSFPSSMVALPVGDLWWSDWGTASRIREVLKKVHQLQRSNGHRSHNKIANAYNEVGNFPLNHFQRDPYSYAEIEQFSANASNGEGGGLR
jgi:hypothetical protein